MLSRNEHARFPKGREEDVLVLHRQRSAYLRGLLPCDLDVCSNPSLALHVECFKVKGANIEHHLIHMPKLLLRKVWEQCLIGVTILVKDLVIIDRKL